MSLLGTAAAAYVVSKSMSDLVLKYSANEYETKINTLEGYSKSLEMHLERLENLKGRIGEFWKDEQAAIYVEVITLQIIAVRQAMDDVTELKMMYQNLSGELGGAEIKVKSLVDAAKAVLGGMGD